MFNEEKVAQIASFFLYKAKGPLSRVKLMKLMYLADKEAMKQLDAPISFDHFVSMPKGPVLSQTLDLINGSSQGIWNEYISDLTNYQIGLNKTIRQDNDLDLLAESEVSILNQIWEKFNDKDQWELVNYTHDPNNCPEWEDPKGSSYPIRLEKIYIHLGRSQEEAEELADNVRHLREIRA